MNLKFFKITLALFLTFRFLVGDVFSLNECLAPKTQTEPGKNRLFLISLQWKHLEILERQIQNKNPQEFLTWLSNRTEDDYRQAFNLILAIQNPDLELVFLPLSDQQVSELKNLREARLKNSQEPDRGYSQEVRVLNYFFQSFCPGYAKMRLDSTPSARDLTLEARTRIGKVASQQNKRPLHLVKIGGILTFALAFFALTQYLLTKIISNQRLAELLAALLGGVIAGEVLRFFRSAVFGDSFETPPLFPFKALDFKTLLQSSIQNISEPQWIVIADPERLPYLKESSFQDVFTEWQPASLSA